MWKEWWGDRRENLTIYIHSFPLPLNNYLRLKLIGEEPRWDKQYWVLPRALFMVGPPEISANHREEA